MQVKIQGATINLTQDFNFKDIVKINCANAYLDRRTDEPFYVCHLGDVVRKHGMWCEKMPRIQPFYAMKCNPNDIIVKMLASLKLGFDCASKSEIQQALEAGVPADRIIYANPCKQQSHLEFARLKKVSLMTFDSVHELVKIHEIHPHASLVLRIFVGATQALCPLGLKFGAKIPDVESLLELALSLNLSVVGVSFHVGSGCFDAQAYSDAILLSKEVFNIAHKMGINMSLLDIGGGFPGNIDTDAEKFFFDSVCNTINSCLDMHFPESSNVKIIAEPGRYYVSSAFQLSLTVTSIRMTVNDVGQHQYGYFLNDGVYGSFNCTVFDHYIGQHYLLDDEEEIQKESTFPSIFWGPTCDSIDKILDGFNIKKLSIGDCVVFKGMGAYTMAAATTFNGFQRPTIKYYVSVGEWDAVGSLIDAIKVDQNADDVTLQADSQYVEPLSLVQTITDSI